jgi:hypothetical protein
MRKNEIRRGQIKSVFESTGFRLKAYENLTPPWGGSSGREF